jgi:hypothetical protein
VIDLNSRATDLHLLTMFLKELTPQYGFLLTVVSVCGQDKFSALLPRSELVTTLYLRFRKFQIQNDILII